MRTRLYQEFEHSVLMRGIKLCANTKEYLNKVVRLGRSTKHVSANEIMELLEDIARVRKREGR